MHRFSYISVGCTIFLVFAVHRVNPTCVLESDFGFKINCAFKKAGLFRVRNLGGLKAHASLGFSLGDELGFEQSLTNMDPSRRRSVSIKAGVPPNTITETSARPAAKQEKRGKLNRIMLRPQTTPNVRPNVAALESLTTLHRRASTMQPIVVANGPTPEMPTQMTKINPPPKVTIAKALPMSVPPFKPLPPKDESLRVLPVATSTKKAYTPLQIPQSKGPGVAYKNPAPHHVNNLASQLYPVYHTKKLDEYNSITGYGDDTTLKVTKEDINEKIAEIAKAGNISMEAVEAAIALRQQQILNQFANIPLPTTSSTTTTTESSPLIFEPEADSIFSPVTNKQKRFPVPTAGKVMNAPREYYPVGYEKNFDDQFQSKVDLPDTSFHCGDQKYFPGLYGDEGLGCMVFHVCALTDDGLVMKSFLCPESTLFDQTILKCNWWFYVDCKSTRRLYDTNIPVSKSYQLMKALTFFSSYKKEMDDGRSTNPEDMEGIKEAISILENQDASKTGNQGTVQIISAEPATTSNVYSSVSENNSPVQTRHNRDFKNSTAFRNNRKNNQTDDLKASGTNLKDITDDSKKINSRENNSENASNERQHRRRQSARISQRQKTTHKPYTSKPVTTTTVATAVEFKNVSDFTKIQNISETVESVILHANVTRAVEPVNHDANTTKAADPEVVVNQNKTEIENRYEDITASDLTENNNVPVRRFYRSSVENNSKEITIINKEKVHIVRPTPMARLVGAFPTPTATIAKLDEAVLGKSHRNKKTSETHGETT